MSEIGQYGAYDLLDDKYAYLDLYVPIRPEKSVK